MLNFNQFEILTFIEANCEDKLTQRDIATATELSLGVTNKVLNELTEAGLVVAGGNLGYEITPAAYTALEPYKVRRVVFMAAGFGSRMVPVTLNTPKPLIMVHGKKIIETLLDAVLDAGITDITIVRGYLGEQFDLLLKKYPMIKFVDNPKYNEANNISSMYLVKDMLENAYVLESDLVLYNKKLIRKYEYASNYLGMPVDCTDDWCFETKKGIITKMAIGGKNVHHMFGISFWTKEDGKKLAKDIEEVFTSPGGKERYWDEVALRICMKNYRVMVRPVKPGSIVEIDTFNELKQIDSVYRV